MTRNPWRIDGAVVALGDIGLGIILVVLGVRGVAGADGTGEGLLAIAALALGALFAPRDGVPRGRCVLERHSEAELLSALSALPRCGE